MTVVNVRRSDEAADGGADIDLACGDGGRISVWTDGLVTSELGSLGVSARDLLAFAVSAYMADKAVLRAPSANRWTRSIELRMPLIDANAWPIGQSQMLLNLMTGDDWSVVPRPVVEPLVDWDDPATDDARDVPDEVALLSGGLDSLSYLAQVTSAGRRVDFVAHFDPNAPRLLQRTLFEDVAGVDVENRLRQFAVQLSGSEKEPSTRARGVVFIAAGVAVATACGSSVVTIPENGFVSINIPLGPNRLGSLSTRTTHPLTIAAYQDLVDALGLGVELHTPYAGLTKGEVLTLGRSAGITQDQIVVSVSCAHPWQGRWSGERFGNCGYCYACLIRRGGLHASGGDPTVYRCDPRAEEVSAGVGVDFRSVVSFLNRSFRASAVLNMGRMPAGFSIDTAFQMIERARAELRTMIDDGLTPVVRATIGW